MPGRGPLLLAAMLALATFAAAHHVTRLDTRIVEPWGVPVLRHVPVVAGYEPFPPPPHCFPLALEGAVLYEESFEGDHGWTFQGTPLARDLPTRRTPNLWSVVGLGPGDDAGHQGPMRLYFGQTNNWSYETGRHSAGTALSPPLELPADGLLALSFATQWEVEWLKGYDHLFVEADDAAGQTHLLCTANAPDRSDPSGVNGETAAASCSPQPAGVCVVEPAWEQRSIVLPPSLMGQSLRLRFTFDTADSKANPYFGWMVDDVRIVSL